MKKATFNINATWKFIPKPKFILIEIIEDDVETLLYLW